MDDIELIETVVNLNIKEKYLHYIIDYYEENKHLEDDMRLHIKELIKIHNKLNKYFNKLFKDNKNKFYSFHDVMLYNEFLQNKIISKNKILKYKLLNKK